ANNNAVPDPLREPLVRWFSKFDGPARAVTLAVDEYTRARPRPPLTEVYSTVAGGQDVFLLRRGEVDNKQGKAAPGVLQVLTRQGAASSPAPAEASAAKPSELDPRISLANWMTDVDHGAGP